MDLPLMHAIVLLFLAALLGRSACAAGWKSSCPNDTIWCEDFTYNGSPNPRFWDYDIGATGWGNGEVQNYTVDNAVVESDSLNIQVIRDASGGYTSSRINTLEKVWFQYVRLEASIHIPDLTGGLWPAFWMIGANFKNVSWPFCGEIDIAEWGSLAANEANTLDRQVSSAMHWDNNGHASVSESLAVETSLTEGFHLYSLDWTPEKIEMAVDNQTVMLINITTLEEFHLPMFLVLNCAVGGGYTGISSPTSNGGNVTVDWIRAYETGFSNVTVAPCEECESGASSRFDIAYSLGLLFLTWMTI